MRKFLANKLIRDKLPEILKTVNGTHLDCMNITDEHLIQALKQKLLEESNEVLSAASTDEIKHEIADVLEVIDGLCRCLHIAMEEVIVIKRAKRDARGGFDMGIFCKTINVDERDVDKIQYYADKPEYIEMPDVEDVK